MWGNKSDNSKYYDILGVSKSATQDEIKKAYKKAAFKNHPDKGGDAEKFKELCEANEVLRDPMKRDLYDEYGEGGLNEGMGGGGGSHDPFQIFESLFGGGQNTSGVYSRDQGKQKRRGDNVVGHLKLSLEEMYNGTTKKLSLSDRNVICSSCSGKGSKSGASTRCVRCQGSGMRMTRVPYLYFPREFECSYCKGSGSIIDEEDKCEACKGEKVVKETKEMEVHIDKGVQQGHKIVFISLANEAPDCITGDLIIILQEKEHPKFKREGDDLFVEHTLSLTEALCGFQFVLTHLDGRLLLIKSAPGQIIKHGECKAINDEGMPHYWRPFVRGMLYLHFSVDFPKSGTLSVDQIKTLEAIFPRKPSSEMTEIVSG